VRVSKLCGSPWIRSQSGSSVTGDAHQPACQTALTTRTQISPQPWTLLDSPEARPTADTRAAAHVIRERSVVQVHLGPLSKCRLTRRDATGRVLQEVLGSDHWRRVLSLPFRWVWQRLVLWLGEEGSSQGWMRDQAFDEAAADRGLDGWTSGDAVGETDDFGHCA
jgi:hypothetical protein